MNAIHYVKSTQLSLFVVLGFLFFGCRGPKTLENYTQPITHEIWDGLLKKHVSAEGWVNYAGFVEDSVTFVQYLDLLRDNPPNKKNWSRDARMAYWINAYNAFTVEIVRRNYPVKSIRDIGPKVTIPFVNTVWDIKFIVIGGKKYDLNNLEHKMLRKGFNDPRIHFAVNCASYSCPKLLNEAYTTSKLQSQLDAQGRAFVNDGIRNKIDSDKLELSKIFNWYKGDFTKSGSLKDFLRKYSEINFEENAEVTYMDYNWELNQLVR